MLASNLAKDVINYIMIEMLVLAQRFHPDTGEEPDIQKFAERVAPRA